MADVPIDGGQVDSLGQILDNATKMIAARQLELEAKGYPPSLVRAAVERARATAEYKITPLSPTIQGRAFLDFLQDELAKAEDWATKQKRFLDEGTSEEE